ncbi:MAG: dUTP diphosphatase [Halieaceae bacterium]|jgi:dimeric dUTPase (all-alpha-NTP-PPase superfamily)|nr:dUTP diphosphatase [Halieaceae bacterium]
MKQALINMLTMQNSMNTRVHEEWSTQDFEWYRALWIECGELIDHYGYKWWKRQVPDMPQVQLEIIDIWHFGMSALFSGDKTIEDIAADIVEEVDGYQPTGLGVREATEELALHTLQTQGFSPSRFWELMSAAELGFEELYTAYIGKNVLNFFRQDHGYKEGHYIKNWSGREDNEHLVELLADLDSAATDFADQVYSALQSRYRDVASRD